MKRILAMALAFVVFVSCFMLPTAAVTGDESAGISLGDNDYYKIDKTLGGVPNTMEAWVYIPQSVSVKSVGTIISNDAYETASITYGISASRQPMVSWTDPDGTEHEYTFSKAKLPLKEWAHLAIVRDMSSKYVRCYVNGELKQSISFKADNVELCAEKFVVGGDHRANNSQYFKGYIQSLALYSDARTLDEIKVDMTTPGKDDLLLHYDFSDSEDTPDVLTDLSGNGCDATHSVKWMDTIESDFDYAYSMAVVSDTQIVAHYNPDNFPSIYDWIVDNVEEKKIEFVIGLGDITDASTKEEFDLAQANIFKLNGIVPYSLARGNHDAMNPFNKYFNVYEYAEQLDGQLGGRVENTYQELIVGDVKYLIVTLDYGPATTHMNWANQVIASHPDHNVILVTHAYLGKDARPLDSSEENIHWSATNTGYHNGIDIWETVVSQHENIVMVLCGHISTDDVIVNQRKGIHGNTVTEMLIDFQSTDNVVLGGCGIVTMFYFSEDGKTLRVENYSTIQEKYFKSCNQFTIQLDMIGDDETVEPMSAFDYVRPYTDNFTDISKDAWFASFVESAYCLKLANGTSATQFSPDSTFTVAQALTAAANIHKVYYGKTIRAAAKGEAWYVPYVEYCVNAGIITEGQFTNYDAAITRGDMAIVFANTLTDSEYAAIRSGSPADIAESADCYAAVKKLYEAGIVSGDAGTGNYRPNESIKRSEACVIFTRIAMSDMRAKV